MTKQNLATIGNITTNIVDHLFKVLGLVVSFFPPFFFFTNANNIQPYSTEQKAELNFYFRSVNDQTKCPAIQTFDWTKPIVWDTGYTSCSKQNSLYCFVWHNILKTKGISNCTSQRLLISPVFILDFESD